jgi:hypothetical protein
VSFFVGCNVKPVDGKKWEDIVRRLLHLEKTFALGIGKENSRLTFRVNGKTEPLTPDKFLWIILTSQWAALKATTKMKLLLYPSRGSQVFAWMYPPKPKHAYKLLNGDV